MPGDRVLVDMSAYGLRVPFTDITLVERGEPQRGDIALLKSPVDGTRLIKRVVAVGGDRVSLVDGHLSINGETLATATAPDVEHFGQRRVQLNLDHGGVNGGLKVLVDNIQQNQGTQGHGQGYLGSLKSVTPERASLRN